MPTVLRLNGCRFYFYPVAYAKASGFRPHEINAILALVAIHRATLLEAWHEYFG